MTNIIEFDKSNFRNKLKDYASYRKCYGLLTANMCYLPIVTNGFVLKGEIDKDDIRYLQEKYGSVVMCRIDAPFNSWKRIPRGRDIAICELNDHYKQMRSFAYNYILLCFQHPSLFFAGEFIERWEIYGGVNVLILWNNQISIEYVGKGFDVGDITRGTNNIHQSITIQWEMRNRNIAEIWNAAKMTFITDEDYTLSRKLRIDTLLKMGYKRDVVEGHLPLCPFPLEFSFFNNFYRECVLPIIWKKKLFVEDEPITVLVNAYGDSVFHVFEIWGANT